MVKYLTKEPNPSSPIFATNARILEFSNYAQQEVASRTQCFISSNVPNSTGNPTLSTVAGTRLYDFPSDCLELLTVKVSVWTCKRMTLDQLNMLTGYQWWQYSGPPLYYWIEKKNTNSFGLWWTPQAVYPIALWYVRKPTAMVNGSDTPDVDRRLDMAVVYYTCEKVMEGRREMNFKSGYWMQKYEQEIEKYNVTADQSLEPVAFLGSQPLCSD